MERDEYTDRYVNPYTDFGFKKLFGTEMNKELLISFINSLLSDKEQIRDLTYLNTENLGISEADRKAVFDVYCETDSGEKILVEMQRGQQLFFKERSLYYASFPIQQQGKRGDWDYQLKAVYVIAILNFVFDHTHDGYFHHEVQLTDSKTREVFYDKLTFIYLEMPKFNKKEEELDSMQPHAADGKARYATGTRLYPVLRGSRNREVHRRGIPPLRNEPESIPRLEKHH